MERLEAGERLGLEQVYREHGDRLWWAVLAFTGDRALTDDAVAEAFAQALRRGDAVRDALAWVWRAAFRIASGELKRRRRFQAELPEIAYEMPERTASLIVALRQLSPNQRAAVVLHYYADQPVVEIARTLAMAPATVSVHLHRGRARLRTILGDPDV